MPENKVVSHADVEELRRVADLARERYVFFRWLRIAGWVIVEEDDAERVKIERQPYDVSCAHEGALQRTDEDFALLDDAIARVEEEHAQVFLHAQRVVRREPRASGIRMKQSAVLDWSTQCPLRKLDRRCESRCISGTNAFRTTLDAPQKRWKALAEESPRRSEIRVGTNAGPSEDCDELRIAKGRGAVPTKTRSWMLVAPQDGRHRRFRRRRLRGEWDHSRRFSVGR